MSDETRQVSNATLTRIFIDGHGPLEPGDSTTVAAGDSVTELLGNGALELDHGLDIADATVETIIEWVGEDRDRAAYAHGAETGRPDAQQRSTLLAALAPLLEDPDSAAADTPTSPQED